VKPRLHSAGTPTHDVIAIGCGPFNLGLAALASRHEDLDVVVLEQAPELRWHPGLGFEDARLQVSFLADLVSLVDPTHPFSFLSYLRSAGRLYAFYVRETFHPTRREYEDYLRWAAAQLPSVRFSRRVECVDWDPIQASFTVDVCEPRGARARLRAHHLVIGIGTEPLVPAALRTLPAERVIPAGHYLQRTADVERARHVALVGSGQSGAEIALDLLRRNLAGRTALSWITRTHSFAPLDTTKLVLEMTTPGYMRYFHALEESRRDALVAEQWHHYKGISRTTLEEIHELLYRRELERELPAAELRCGVAVESSALAADGRIALRCRHRDSGALFTQSTDLVIAATGYAQRSPQFLEPLAPRVRRDASGRFRVRLDHSLELDDAIRGAIFVAHADLHSHGVSAPDLGIAAYRNAVILNRVLGREAIPLPARTGFTQFDVPGPRGAWSGAAPHPAVGTAERAAAGPAR
jgi:lysine N6-hydroxylase